MKKTLETIKNEVINCRKCYLGNDIIWPCPATIVKSEYMLVLDYPSNEECTTENPLDSRPGQNLLRLLKETNLNPYITFATKCRVASEKDKYPKERVCNSWLFEEIDVLQPKVIITLGPSAYCAFTNKPKSSIKELNNFGTRIITNGLFHYWWHSAYHIFNSGKKIEKETIDLFKQIKEKL